MDNTSKGAIIDQLIRHGTLSRSEMAQRTGWSRSVITVSTLELQRQGIIQKAGTGASSGGRRPDEFRLGGGNHLVIGVAMEDDQMLVSFYSLDGKKVTGSAEPFPLGRTVEEAISQAAQQIAMLRRHTPNATILGCGMALPSIVDAETDLVTSVTHNWQEVPARRLLETALGIPCNFLDNAHGAALGELWMRGRELRENLVYLYFGRGIGGAIILDRQLYLGRNHAAGEFGTMLIGGITEDGPFFGQFDILARIGSLISWMNAVRSRYPASPLPVSLPQDEYLPALATAAAKGDPLALAVRRRLEMFFATTCTNIVNTLNPDEIIIGGPVAVLGTPFANAVYAGLERLALPVPFGSVRVHLEQCRQETIPLGAAATIIQRTAELLTRAPSP
jgi:predicted NBD/HSP70 family sugar kinase